MLGISNPSFTASHNKLSQEAKYPGKGEVYIVPFPICCCHCVLGPWSHVCLPCHVHTQNYCFKCTPQITLESLMSTLLDGHFVSQRHTISCSTSSCCPVHLRLYQSFCHECLLNGQMDFLWVLKPSQQNHYFHINMHLRFLETFSFVLSFFQL